MLSITGATNGIGLDTTEYLARDSPNNHIIMGARSSAKAEARMKEVQAKNPKGTLGYILLDQNQDSSILAAVEQIKKEFGHLDILINNAGVCLPDDKEWTPRDTLRATFETNVFGVMILTEAMLPLLKASKDPMVINVTSGLGSIAALSPELPADHVLYVQKDVMYPGYRMSKAALNMLTAYQYAHLKKDGFKIWAYCPGYVVTDLTGDREAREAMQWVESSETSAQGILDIVHGERDGDVGKFITRRGGEYPW
jgi:NAD(P)-dependent dehydrogenase (short-subunit alcohol dehydrogenase family)